MSIPPIIDFKDSTYRQFFDDITKETFVFLGAGFSKQMGYKLWNELVYDIIDFFWSEKLKGCVKNGTKLTWSMKEELKRLGNKLYVMDYLRRLDKNKYYEAINSIFNKDNKNLKNDIADIIKPLIRDSRYKFLQTNIDKTFQEHCNIPEREIRINPNFSEDVKLNYLHGRIDITDSWIFTQEDYLLNYQNDNSSLMRFLIGIFKKYTVLFIGYSLSDYEILQAIAKARINCNNSKNLRNHYILMATHKAKENELIINEEVYMSNFGINIIKFDIEQRGHDLMQDNLKGLVDAIYPQQKNSFDSATEKTES